MAELEAFRARAQVEEQNKKIAYLEVENLWNGGRLEIADRVYAPEKPIILGVTSPQKVQMR